MLVDLFGRNLRGSGGVLAQTNFFALNRIPIRNFNASAPVKDTSNGAGGLGTIP